MSTLIASCNGMDVTSSLIRHYDSNECSIFSTIIANSRPCIL